MKLVCPIAAALLGLAAAAAEASAQTPGGAPRIGYLETYTASAPAEAFLRGLNDLGYLANRTIVIERRSAAGQVERLPDLAAELVRLQPQVIVASNLPAVFAARDATTTIPIVMANNPDPVGLGLIASLARPGGNITGLSNLATGLAGKRLELLAAIVPGLSRVGVVWSSGYEGPQLAYRELQAAAATLGLTLESFEVTRLEEFDAAFQAAATRAGGVAVLNSPIVGRHRDLVLSGAARHKVPTIYYDTQYAEAGGLMSYGANIPDLHRRAAVYVDKILKGAKPADLPVEQPTTFSLVINLKTAKALGIDVPAALLARADEVIE